ncbi:NADH-cytochrome b5 reductase-like [Galleria mellonella]|uniref:NADH-cytochrome b5 reductase n=1 Tax=Galleria mellonella TaxID=7137 RepID=A0A6J1WCQ4_GALME|nr:NADH-cytochrome b5 reductase-like [Galleria mellonella]
MKPPIEPNREDCCNSGCNPCIFDIYEKQLAIYKKYQETGEKSDMYLQNAISQTEYTTFIVISNTEICVSHNLILLKKMPNTNSQTVVWNPGDHFLVKYNSVPCTRAYTPVKLKRQNHDDFDFSIIVKKYTHGLVSNYLCDLKSGDETLWRGPYGFYEVTRNKFNRIIMVAQGTGILPFVSIIEKILSDEDDMTKLVLYYCCQNISTVLFRDELYTYQCYWNFTYKIFINDVPEKTCHKYREPITSHKLHFKDVIELEPFSIHDQFMICGSSKFIKDYETFLKNENGFPGNIILF